MSLQEELVEIHKHRVGCLSNSPNLTMGVSAVVIRYWWLGMWCLSAPRETHPWAQSNEWNIIPSIMGFVRLSSSCLNSETRIISTKGWGFYCQQSSFLFFVFALLCSLFCLTALLLFFPPSLLFILSVTLAVPWKKKRKRSLYCFSVKLLPLRWWEMERKKHNY